MENSTSPATAFIWSWPSKREDEGTPASMS
jgi:hypothetical protein